jgi:hypothetical protein
MIVSEAAKSASSQLAIAGTKALEAYIAAGDIGKLGPDQRIALYRAVCDSMGLNPLTQPFQYLTLSGKTVLYATKSCTEQLRSIHGVSVVRMEREIIGDILTVTVAVTERTGREDMKAETKAKRRATLSICGLAVLDETEVDSIAGAQAVSVQEFHAEPKKPSKPTREERRKDLDELTNPTPIADRVPEVVADDCITILARSPIGVVEGRNGRRVWRIDQEDQPLPIAVLSEAIASGLEANQAFSVNTRVRVKPRANGGFEVVEIIGDAP